MFVTFQRSFFSGGCLCRKFTDDDDSESEQGKLDINATEPTSYYDEQEAIRQRLYIIYTCAS